jgi:hypothetical protein
MKRYGNMTVLDEFKATKKELLKYKSKLSPEDYKRLVKNHAIRGTKKGT